MTKTQPHPRSTTVSITDEPAVFELTSPGSGEETRAQGTAGTGRARPTLQARLLARAAHALTAEQGALRRRGQPGVRYRGLWMWISLDLAALGFIRTVGPRGAGQSSCDPANQLKLDLYGYLTGVRNTRRLALECERDLEVIWVLGGLTPGYRSIGDSRKANANGLLSFCDHDGDHQR